MQCSLCYRTLAHPPFLLNIHLPFKAKLNCPGWHLFACFVLSPNNAVWELVAALSIQSYRKIKELVRKKTPLVEGMHTLLDLCQELHPSPRWKKLYRLKYEDDLLYLAFWLETLLATEPPPRNVTGFWFGLFNPILEHGEPTSCLYLAGSKLFDPERQVPDWACSPFYWPAGRYSDSAVLTEIYRTVSKGGSGIGALGEYTLCLGYAALVVAACCRSPLRDRLLGKGLFRGVVVGFDSGDEILIDVLRNKQVLASTR